MSNGGAAGGAGPPGACPSAAGASGASAQPPGTPGGPPGWEVFSGAAEEDLWGERRFAGSQCRVAADGAAGEAAAGQPTAGGTATKRAAPAAEALAAKRGKAVTSEELMATEPQEVAEYIRAQGWHAIASPQWEGNRWQDLLQRLDEGVVDKEEVVEQVMLKLKRQKAAWVRLGDKGAGGPARAAAAAAPPPAPRPVRAPELPPGCTCGCPIHSEKCRLFRSTAGQQARAVLRGGTAAQAAPRPQRPAQGCPARGQEPRGSPASPPLLPRSGLSGWAEVQLTKVDAEVAALPRAQWKTLWKQKMRAYHPDKRLAVDSPAAGVSEEQVTEVFLELKRRYDLL